MAKFMPVSRRARRARPVFRRAAMQLWQPPEPVRPNGYRIYGANPPDDQYWLRAIDGLGRIDSPVSYWELSSPSMALYRRGFRTRSIDGFGQETTAGGWVAGLGAGMLAAVLLLAVAVNYQIGKAMAPNKQKEAKWAWGNAIGGTLFPPVTLGMAIYKNYFAD